MRTKLDEKIRHKQMNAERNGLRFLLSKPEIEQLLAEAGITEHEWTNAGYHLARYGDAGDYVWGNCRFISYIENAREKKISERVREWARKLGQRSDVWTGRHHSDQTKQKMRLAASLRTEDKNSQFGTFWITNGTTNRKWHQQKGALPVGFYKGRHISRSANRQAATL